MAKHKDVLEAERRIREAIEEEASHLNLSELTGLNSLEGLEVDIADAKAVTDLFLYGTQISDLGPIAEMWRLEVLTLNNTPLTDLTAISKLRRIKALYLEGTKITDLSPIAEMRLIEILRLPHTLIQDFSYLSNFRQLQNLYLEGTSFSDLTVLSRTTKLQRLDLANSKVADLRPLLKLQFEGDFNENTLRVTNTPAALADARIAEIDAMEDHEERVATLLDYLKDWVPPVPSDTPSARAFSYDGDGPITSPAMSPDADDPDQRDLQDDLQTKVANLAGQIGGSNELGHLSSSVDSYARQINRPLADLRLKLIYSAANSLRVAYEAHNDAKDQARDMECLPPQVAAALQDVVETHALFYMGFPEGVDIHQTMMSGLTGQRQPDVTQLATDLVDALRGRDDVMSPDDQAALADDAIAATGKGPSAEIGERSLIGSLGNAFGAVGRFVWAHKGKFTAGTTYAVLQWMVAKEVAITKFLVAYQGPYAAWFKAVIEFVKPWV